MSTKRDERVKATARVRLTIDLPVPDAWGSDCAVAQIQRQAAEAAEWIVRKVIETRTLVAGQAEPVIRRETELGILLATGKARIIDSEVVIVLVEQER